MNPEQLELVPNGDFGGRPHFKRATSPYSALARPSFIQVQRQQKRILDALVGLGNATCEELEEKTGLSHSSASARISELKKDGLMQIEGYGYTKSHNKCARYVLADHNIPPIVKEAVKIFGGKIVK